MESLSPIVRPMRLVPDPERFGEFVLECICPSRALGQPRPPLPVEGACAGCVHVLVIEARQ